MTRPTFRCALLNCNGLFRSDGALHDGFYGLVASLCALDVGALLLTEPHLPVCARLPSDQPFCLHTRRSEGDYWARGCDAAIAINEGFGLDCVAADPIGSRERDIAAVVLRHGTNVAPTILCAAYAPDTSRGAQSRSDFWQRLAAFLRLQQEARPDADMIVGLDSNTWLDCLDRSRRPSSDGDNLRALLEALGLRIVSTPGVSTHRSGTIIDIVAVSAGVEIRNYMVHSPCCARAGCVGAPGCYPALSSDHNLVSFEVAKAISCARDSADWRFAEVDWSAVIRADLDGVRAWHRLVTASEEVVWGGCTTGGPRDHFVLLGLVALASRSCGPSCQPWGCSAAPAASLVGW